MTVTMNHLPIRLAALLLVPLPALNAAELTPSELALKRQLGEDTTDPIPLWPGQLPRIAENAPPETVIENAKIHSVPAPTITPYLPAKEKRNGMAIIVCAGGGYRH